MHIICIAQDIISKTNFKITKVFFLLRYFNKTRVLVLLLRFPYFKLRNITNSCKNSNQYTVMDLFVDIGAGLVLSMWFLLAILYLTLVMM